jgi:dienelactone hydrolase
MAMLLFITAFASNGFSQSKRYIDDVFTSFNKTANIEYDTNRSINLLYGTPYPGIGTMPMITVSLKCDIYQPAGDTAAKRPLVIVASTGSFLPAILNQQVTGSKDDSSVVELCTRLAMKGYVAVAMNYRGGWNPSASQAIASEQLIQAAFRGIQDVHACVRYMRKNMATYKIDTSMIIVGGQGTGGYLALGVATVNSRAKIEGYSKFQRSDFTPMVNVDTLGDWNGLGPVSPGLGYFHFPADPTIPANVHMAFHYGGAMGDSGWLDNSSLPIVGLQTANDYFAPYHTGNVIVPTTGATVIPHASGAGDIVPKANRIGVNAKLNAKTYTDPVSVRGMSLTGQNNLYPFMVASPLDASPWEWWDRATVQATNGIFYQGFPVPVNGHAADSSSFALNPGMSAARGKAYIDTVLMFVCPRIVQQFDLGSTGIAEPNRIDHALKVYPNPASSVVNVELAMAGKTISTIEILDITGKLISSLHGTNTNSFELNLAGYEKGMYLVHIETADGNAATQRLIVR